MDEAITKALEARPEIIEARTAVDNARLNEKAVKNAARHQLDLTAAVTPQGNNLIDVIPGVPNDTFVTGDVGTPIPEIPKLDNYVWSLG